MNTLIQAERPLRSVLRSAGVLAVALVMTAVSLVALGAVVDVWS